MSELTEPFWSGGLSGELRLQQCANCGHVRYPISRICPRCLSPDAAWAAMSGRGVVQSYIVFERAYHQAWAGQVPYVVALIELAEGPVLISNVVGVYPLDGAGWPAGVGGVRTAFRGGRAAAVHPGCGDGGARR